jgi:Uma2 family endonuclease
METVELLSRDVSESLRRFSVDEFHSMERAGVFHPEERLELIQGKVYNMSPIGPFHGGVTDILAEYFWELSNKRWIVRTQNPVQLSYESEPQPDIALVRRASHHYKSRHPVPEDVFLLIEISDTTLSFDLHQKLPLYASAGIAEVWIVDLIGQTIQIYREPADGAYKSAGQIRPGEFASPSAFPEAKVDAAELFRRIE